MKLVNSLVYAAGVGILMGVLSFSDHRNSKVPHSAVPEHSDLWRTEDGYQFRDLNKNGKLDIYEDTRQPVEKRVDDLLKQMNLEEKAGMMFYVPTRVNRDGTIEE